MDELCVRKDVVISNIKKTTEENDHTSKKEKQIFDSTSLDENSSLVLSSNEKDYFSSLPDEIISEIFKYLPLKDIRQPVNKRWYAVSFSRLSKITLEDKIIQSKHLKCILDCGVKVLQFKYCQIIFSSLRDVQYNHMEKHMDAARFDKLQNLSLVDSYIDERILKKILTSHLRVLELSGNKSLSYGTFSNIFQLNHLEELKLCDLKVKSNDVEDYRCDKLRSLHLAAVDINANLIDKLLTTDLKVLELNKIDLDDRDYDIFRKIFKMKHLEKLALVDFDVNSSSMQDCEKLCNLRYLRLIECHFETSETLEIFLSCCSQLSHLVLWDPMCTVDDNVVRKMLDMKELQRLEMNCYYMELTHHLQPEVHRESFCNLRHLNLVGGYYETTKTMQKFLAFFSHVTHFELDSSSVRKGVISFDVFNYMNLYGLRYLKLHELAFDGSETLVKLLSGCNQLTHLYLHEIGYTLNVNIFREILNMKELERLELQELEVILTSSVKSINFERLNFLRLKHCAFCSPESLENLLSCCNKIAYFVLDGNRFLSYDADFRCIARLEKLNRLTVNDNLASDHPFNVMKCCPYIAQMEMLNALTVNNVINLTSIQAIDIKECCPKRCVLIFNKDSS